MAKNATRPVVTLISESHEEVVFIGDTIRGTGTLIPDNEVMAYPEIPDVTAFRHHIRSDGISGQKANQVVPMHG